MARKQKILFKKKDKYRLRNWGEYNRSLVNRGSITFWFGEEVSQKWYSTVRTGKRGKSNTYSDDAIRCGLMIRAVFRTPLRALQGLIQSLLLPLGLVCTCPHYSRFCRRAKTLSIPVRRLLKPGEKLNVVFDSTGVKVHGEGEWKVRQHGYSKRRTWRKVHVGMCADTGQVVVSAMTSNNVSDGEAMVEMMASLDGVALGDCLGDGAYDTVDCRDAIHALGGRLIIPPSKNAKKQKKGLLPALEERDQVIARIEELGENGRKLWKEETGYHRRSRVETLMFRFKTILGDRLASRKAWSQTTEMAIKLDVLNKMLELNRPQSYKVTT